MTFFTADEAGRRIASFRQQSGRSINANFLLWPAPGDLSDSGGSTRARLQPLFDSKNLGRVPVPKVAAGGISPDHLEILRKTKPEVVSFHFGLPDQDQLREIKAFGAMVFGCATTVAEAKSLEAAGADAIIVQGIEAGGHRGTFTGVDYTQQAGLFSLLPQVVDAVSVPIIAAGGISDGRTMAAALMMGASAVHIGTAFLACSESVLHESHRAAIHAASETSTIVTKAITGRPARMISNRLVSELSDLEGDALPFPAQSQLTKLLGADGDPDFVTLYAGQSAALARKSTANELMARLVEETDRCIKSFN